MYRCLRSIFLATVLLLVGFEGFAQSYQVNSPFSRFGIGSLQPSHFAVNQAMGGFAAAYSSPTNINYVNPASYSAIRLTAFETGIYGSGLWVSDETVTNKSGTGALAYMAFGFPAAKFWGLSAGLIPYTSANYNVIESNTTEEFGLQRFRFIGDGQWSQFYIGNGFNVKNFSFGFNAAYLFGNIKRESLSFFTDIDDSLGNRRTENLTAGDFIFNAGVQYKHLFKNEQSKKDYQLTIGLSSDLPVNINVENDVEWARGVIDASNVTIVDTVFLTEVIDGTVKMPLRLKAGIAFSKPGSWTLGTDIGFENWESFEAFGEKDAALSSAINIATGFEFTPFKRGAINNFWQSTYYRLGAFYNTGRLTVNENKLSEFGVSFGLGIPLRKISSRLNFSFEAGQRGSINNNQIRETFLNATFGFTLNDIWFAKRKFD